MGKRCKNDEDGNRLFLLKVERLLLQNRSFRFHSCRQCVCLHNTPGCLLTWRSGICSRAAMLRARTYPFGLSLRAHLVAEKSPLCLCRTVKPLAGGFTAAAGSCLLRWARGASAARPETCRRVLRGSNNSVFAVDRSSAVGNGSVFSKQGYDRMTTFGRQDPGCSYIR